MPEPAQVSTSPVSASPAVVAATITAVAAKTAASTSPSTAKPSSLPAASAGSGEPTKEPVRVEVDPTVSKTFAEIERRKQAITAGEQKLAAERAAVAKDVEAATAYKQAIADAKKDPIKFLSGMGITLDDLERTLTPGAKIDPVTSELSDLKAELAALKEDRKQEKQRAEQEAGQKNVQKTLSEIKELVEKDPATYKLTAKRGEEGVSLVYDVLVQHWLQTGGGNGGKILPYETAAQKVEAYYKGLVDGLADPQAEPAKPQAAKPGKPQAETQVATLTNKLNSDSVVTEDPDPSQRTAQLKKKAVAVLQERMAAKRAALAKKAG
jgi:outer membrane murein-binding lipoprotein Lpp